MPERQPRLLRENNPDFRSFVLDGSHIRDIPATRDGGPADRVIVALPWSYNEQPARQYPVVYLCDGFWDFPLVWGMYSHLLWDAVIPEYILVGLAYGGEDPDVGALRKLDLAPPPHSAGSSLPSADAHGNDYLSRLKHAIIPFVESEYGADPSFRVLAGCSIGGLFAMGAMFREPQLFNAIIALSATVATENRWLFKLEQQFRAGGGGLFSALIRRRRELPVRLFMAAGGDDDPSIIAALGDFDAQLGRSNYRFFEKSFRIVDGEKHAALKPEGFNRGIRFAFKSLVTL